MIQTPHGSPSFGLFTSLPSTSRFLSFFLFSLLISSSTSQLQLPQQQREQQQQQQQPMPKRKQRRGEAGRGGGDVGRGGGGYNNGNYQGHGNWGNIPNYPTPHPNYNPQMGQGYNPNLQMGPGYNHNPPMGQGYNSNPQMGQVYNQNPQMGQGYNQNPQMGQGYNQNPQMGQGYNTYQFEPNVPWQPGNEPSNPFSQSHQASQTQQSQNNGGQQWGRRKRRQKISELNEGQKRKFNKNEQVHPLIWKVPVLVLGSKANATPVAFFEPLRHRLIAPENDGFADDAESLPDAEGNEESNAQVPAQNEPGVCGTCKMPGHEVIQCWQMGPDGFTHGCGVCNSGAHETDQCQSFPQDLDGKIEILVKRRACLPPLKTAFWYSMIWKWVKKNPSTDVNHLFPWTTKFAIDVLNGDRKSEVEGMLATIRNDPSIERSEFIVDPARANWEKVKETYGGDPKNFFEKLRATKGADQEQRVTNVGKLPSS
ncbi:hypothetical protein FNAPI_8513 [Fusarium napiforme]|uniref:Uncharacterized protein n=1 Tax=Fusarium napiforme TaxID=42672 RepID=A0A8H5J6U7_9HYPO|nr:hypothetical protein FNAPI_8513 [Fusarium napiforme]